MTNKIYQLKEDNLKFLSNEVHIPRFDRSEIKTRVVHIGIGGFHRAHQVFYMDELLEREGGDWGICGVALLEQDERIYNVLENQDNLYTLMVQGNDVLSVRILGSLKELIFAPKDPEKLVEKLANKDTRIVTLTITEGGYDLDFDGDNVRNNLFHWDLKYPDKPRSIFGYLIKALKIRKNKKLPLTIQSCDNIQRNGEVTRNVLLNLMERIEPDLVSWVKKHVSFPNSMVDRITPVTSSQDIEMLKAKFGIVDRWPVVSEEFHQWIIEDDFKAGRPDWEKVGVKFVDEVAVYEKMKLRMLNGGHSLVGIIGGLKNYTWIDETMQDPLIKEILVQYLEEEVIPLLGDLPGIDLFEYKDTIIKRFSNPYIKDGVERIIGQSSAKLPKFIIPTICENLIKEKPSTLGILILASWYVYLKRQIAVGEGISDDMQEDLISHITRGSSDPKEFLSLKSVFGTLNESEQFVTEFSKLIEEINRNGIDRAARTILQQ